MSLDKTPSRLTTLTAGFMLQVCLGSVYAWSIFVPHLQKPAYGWSNGRAAAVFSLAVGFLGVTAAFAGPRLARLGYRKAALYGAGLFVLGHLVAALALVGNRYWLMCLGYGVLGGVGNGLGYVSGVAAAAASFPKRKGLATGFVVMGFGLGALVMSKVLAPWAVAASGGDLPRVFLAFAALFAVVAPLSAWFLRAEPPAASSVASSSRGGEATTLAIVWGMFFLNCISGLGLLAFQAPLMAERVKSADPFATEAALTAAGSTLVAVGAIANGAGRFLWGALSDRVGRVNTFLLLLGTQTLVFLLLPFVSDPLIFGALIAYVMLCYGGGFGTLPALVGDTFGAARLGAVYGRMLTAWGTAGILGPLVFSLIKDAHAPAEAASVAFRCGAGALALGFVLALVLAKRPVVATQAMATA